MGLSTTPLRWTKVEGYEINLSFVKVAYTARDNDVVVASLNKGGQASNIVSVTNTFAGRAPVALAPDDSVLVCCNRSTAMDIQVMRREGDEQKMKQCQLLNGQHDMIVNSVVVDGATVVSGGWDQRAVFWVKTPQNLFFSFVFRNWKGVSTSSVRL